jgi:hypothetical protein
VTRFSRGWAAYGEVALAGAGFLALALGFFWRLWALNPADRQTIGAADGDFLRQFYPYRAFVARAWAMLQPPLWNPHQYAGTPAWADPQLAVLYPWRLLQVPLALGGRVLPLVAVHAEVVAHVALAGWFTFLLARRLGAGTWPATLAGVTFAFGGYLTGYPLEQLAVLDTAVWLPATLWALTAAVDAWSAGIVRTGRRWAVAAAGATALAVLAGHPQTAMYCAYAGLAWLVWRGWSAALGWRRTAVLAGLWLGLAAGLSAAAWLPAAGFLARSARQLDAAALLAGFPVRDVVQVLAPHVVSQWSPLYVGVVALGLAAAGWRVAPAARPWLVGAGVAWVVSLGGRGPLLPVLLRVAPGFALFRQQERIAVLVSLGVAVAAALVLQALVADLPARAGRAGHVLLALAAGTGLLAAVGRAGPATGTLAPFAGALAFTALVAALAGAVLLAGGAGRLPGRAVALALVALAVFDLFSVNRGRALTAVGAAVTSDPLVAALLPHARDGRMSSEGRLAGGPNAASLLGLFDTTGDSPLQLRATDALVRDLPELVWWRLLGVRYLVTERAFAADAPVAELARAGGRALYEVRMAVPPAWVPERVTSVAGPWRPGPAFDPQAEAVVPATAGVPELATGPGGTAEVVGLANDRVTVRATLPRPGLVVAATAYDPGWRVTARADDGRTVAAATVPAYGALLGTVLPAGAWRVEWTYRPMGVSFGLAVTMLSMMAGLVLWFWPWKRTSLRRP